LIVFIIIMTSKEKMTFSGPIVDYFADLSTLHRPPETIAHPRERENGTWLSACLKITRNIS
jgi:hypothetical protein